MLILTYIGPQPFIVLLCIPRTKAASENSQGKLMAGFSVQERSQDRHDDIAVHGGTRVNIVGDEQAGRYDKHRSINTRSKRELS